MLSGKKQRIIVKAHPAPINPQVQSVLEQIPARLKACKEDGIYRYDDQDCQDGKQNDQHHCGKCIFTLLALHTISPPCQMFL